MIPKLPGQHEQAAGFERRQLTVATSGGGSAAGCLAAPCEPG